LGALTVLSHPEIAWYLGFSLVILLLCYGRRRAAAIDAGLLVAGVGIITAPWWATVLARSGMDPFLSAAQTGGHSWEVWRAFLSWNFAEVSSLNWTAMLAVLGAIACIAQAELFLPIWLVASVVLEPRSGSTYVTAPIAMLAALAIVRYVFPLAERPVRSMAGGAVAAEPVGSSSAAAIGASARELLPRLLPLAAVALFLFYVTFVSFHEVLLRDPTLRGLTANDRAGMAWVRENTPEDSKFAVLAGHRGAFTDRVSEWFPALTERQSVATVQGFEWMGEDEYREQWDRYSSLQACQTIICLESWRARMDAEITHVYMVRNCCRELQRSLNLSSRYELRYVGRTAVVYERQELP
jgi:hypothetical protein